MAMSAKKVFLQQIKPKFALPRRLKFNLRRILDIGIANGSYEECKLIYPYAEYHGLDCVEHPIKMQSGDFFHLRDLESSHSISSLPVKFDLIIANHVLEHIIDGERVFSDLCRQLTSGGILYVEIPSIRTASYLKKGRSYHFHDDPTHCTFYNLQRLSNIAIRNECKVLSAGPISTPLKNLLSIPRALLSYVTGKDWGSKLIHLQKKVEHIMIRKNSSK